ncbi:hypothetical protein SCARR_03067 [Pontiella sulfatireligans]|uniref:Uncharacterized protein n=1 Tax=Pontiella sulfatireligans TaxID=2750658 RepID=A0A6C2ULL1_9BACT|nr:hypothetical protein SCARR_03067 [Pontiella sulfatireligans]
MGVLNFNQQAVGPRFCATGLHPAEQRASAALELYRTTDHEDAVPHRHGALISERKPQRDDAPGRVGRFDLHGAAVRVDKGFHEAQA